MDLYHVVRAWYAPCSFHDAEEVEKAAKLEGEPKMSKTKFMRCPHCHKIGECVWVGFGRDWILCQHCQRRVRWSEVQAKYLVQSREEWAPNAQKLAAYH
jgi:hypothetical protein